MRVAIATVRPDFLDDRIFQLDFRTANNWAARKWLVLRKAVEAAGGAVHTYDWYRARGERWDVTLADDATRSMLALLLSLRVSPRRVVLVLWEPPVVRPVAWRWIRWWAPLLGAVGVGDRDVAGRGRPFEYVPLPQPAVWSDDPARWLAARAHPRSRFATMVRSNKASRHPGELYSRRRELARYFERAEPEAFDLYGWGWNDPAADDPFFTTVYRGEATHQLDVFPDYRFAISIDNSAAPGLVTYDIFSAMLVGTVPVYLGAPDITDFIPSACFIDMRSYPGPAALHARLRTVAAGEEWERYREAGARFLQSEAAQSFTAAAFVARLTPILERVAGVRRGERITA